MSGRTEIRPPPARGEHIWAENFLGRPLPDFRVRAGPDSPPITAAADDFPELDCVRRSLPPDTIAAAERRADAVGVTADRVLVTSGLMSEETYVRALAQSLGLAFEPLATLHRAICPLSDERLIEASAAGLLPLVEGDALTLVVAPRGIAAQRLHTIMEGAPELRRRIRLTTSERLAGFIHGAAGDALGEHAAFGLANTHPALSAAPRTLGWPLFPLFAVIAVSAGVAAAIAAPNVVLTVVSIALSIVFVAWIAFRLIGLVAAVVPLPPRPRQPDASLPVYSVIVALYHEAAAVEQLIASLDSLDWPGIMAQTPEASDGGAPTFRPWPKAPPLPR